MRLRGGLGHLLVLAIWTGRPLTVAHWTSSLYCLCVCSYHHFSEILIGWTLVLTMSCDKASPRGRRRWTGSNGFLAWFWNESLPDLPNQQDFLREIFSFSNQIYTILELLFGGGDIDYVAKDPNIQHLSSGWIQLSGLADNKALQTSHPDHCCPREYGGRKSQPIMKQWYI